MKFWQKAFLILLVVFVVTFNVSMVIVLHFTYKQELGSAREKALGEAYFMTSALTSDFTNMESLGNVSIENKRSAFKVYKDYYEQKKICLGLFREEATLESNLPEIKIPVEQVSEKSLQDENVQSTWAELEIEPGIQKVWIQQNQQEKYLIVMSRLLAPYEAYKLCYAYEISDLEKSNHQLMQMAMCVDLVMLALLGIILLLVLTKLTKPLTQLQKCTAEIAAGNFGETVEVKGQDEIADLGKQFNEMSLKIYDQMELLQEENRKKQLLIDNMAHEFRTPLTSILGYAQYLMMANLNEEERLESIGYVISETNRLQKLSQTILYMADIREDQLEISLIKVKEVIDYLQALFDQQQPYKGITFTATSEVEFIKGNQVMLESLLINLIENGMRACGASGKVSLRITKEEDQVLIQVKDTGIGMSEEELTKIQEPFYRIDKARSRKMGGVGLGVTLCQQIVSLHSAQIHYASTLGEGTCVSIKWPSNEL